MLHDLVPAISRVSNRGSCPWIGSGFALNSEDYHNLTTCAEEMGRLFGTQATLSVSSCRLVVKLTTAKLKLPGGFMGLGSVANTGDCAQRYDSHESVPNN